MLFTNLFYAKYKNKFQDGYLVLEEDFLIDKATTKVLGVADDYKIKAGKYAVVVDKSTNTYNCTF